MSKAPPRQHAGRARGSSIPTFARARENSPLRLRMKGRDYVRQPWQAQCLDGDRLSDAIVAVVSRPDHSSVAENRRTKSGFSFANGDCVTHMRQGFPLKDFLRRRCAVSAQPRLPPRHGQLRGQGVPRLRGRCRCDEARRAGAGPRRARPSVPRSSGVAPSETTTGSGISGITPQ
jgi:hypothetical protein